MPGISLRYKLNVLDFFSEPVPFLRHVWSLFSFVVICAAIQLFMNVLICIAWFSKGEMRNMERGKIRWPFKALGFF